MGLVVQIGADHRGIVGIARGQHLQSEIHCARCAGYRTTGRWPSTAPESLRWWSRMIFRPDLAGIGHDLVHDLHGRKTLQIRFCGEIDVGCARGVDVSLEKGKRCVEAEVHHLIHHRLVVARHRPCGARSEFSKPNQFTPAIWTEWPAESTIWLPEVLNSPRRPARCRDRPRSPKHRRC